MSLPLLKRVREESAGFTLVEILIVALFLGIFSVVVTQALFNIMQARNKARIVEEVKQSGDYALSIMEQEIRDAARLTECTRSTIVFRNSRGQKVTFGSSSRIPIKQIGDGDQIPLVNDDTQTGVRLTNPESVFTCKESRITINLTLEPGSDVPTRGDYSIDPVELKTTVVIRNK
ncbi:MAG: type II secretion system protein [Patescibacteria group bacterium]